MVLRERPPIRGKLKNPEVLYPFLKRELKKKNRFGKEQTLPPLRAKERANGEAKRLTSRQDKEATNIKK